MLIHKLSSLDVKMGEARPGEWLHSRTEKGQTFEHYKTIHPTTVSNERNVIYLFPIGEFTPLQDSIVELTRTYLNCFFGLRTIVGSSLQNPERVSDGKREFDGNTQLLTTTVFNYLKDEMRTDAVVTLAITTNDLYPGPDWNFVFGQGHTRDRIGVSSMLRFTDGELTPSNFSLCLTRMIKTASHEIGHMFSLQHCTHAVCLMNGSNSLGESDGRPNRLCAECHKKLQWNLRFDVVQRIEKLKEFSISHHLDDEGWLYRRDLAVLQAD